MKLQSETKEFESNFQAVSQDFGIGDASVVIDILRNRLYQYKIRTLVQEYICNARDANREVSATRQIEITLPSTFDPTFKVRDFGPGISPDRIATVFVLYGASTKRNTNSQTGGFGIGAKSAWSYTDSFTIATFIDGVKRTYVAHTGANNQGRLDFIGEEIAEFEPNGTQIEVAVKGYDIAEFVRAAFRATHFWKAEETPEFKGRKDSVPPRVQGLKLWNFEVLKANTVTDFVDWDKYSGNNNPIAVIDGVVYDLSGFTSKVKSLANVMDFCKEKVVLYLDNGDVEVSASRESIADSQYTLSQLESYFDLVLKRMKLHLESQFQMVTSLQEFIDAYEKADISGFKFDSREFDHWRIERYSNMLSSPKFKEVYLSSYHCFKKTKGYGREKGERVNEDRNRYDYLRLKELKNVFYIDDASETTAQRNKRIRSYIHSGPDNLFILHPQTGNEAVYEQLKRELNAKPLSSIAIVLVVREPREAKPERNETEILVHRLRSERNETVPVDLKTSATKYLYIQVKEGKWDTDISMDNLRSLAKWVQEQTEYVIAGMAERTINKVKDNPNFGCFKSFVETFVPTLEQLDQMKSKVAQNSELRCLKGVTGIDDKTLQNMVTEYKDFNDGRYCPEIVCTLFGGVELEEFKKRDERLTKRIQMMYPLFNKLDAYDFEGGYYSSNCLAATEVVAYFNAKYAVLAAKKENVA